MKNRWIFFTVGLTTFLPFVSIHGDQGSRPTTICNPMNLPYRFQLSDPVRREAADPTMVVFKNEYWLFPSKSGGYWHSPDCVNWTYVKSSTLPVEAYAPAAEVVDGKLYWAVTKEGIWTTDDPATDAWRQISNLPIGLDADLFSDHGGGLFVYEGCSNHSPIVGYELDKSTLHMKGRQVVCLSANTADHGWEALKGGGRPPWIEGAWMNEHKGTYYLQYAAPGTESSNYGDGVYTAKAPLGPFTYAPYSPFSFKPTGFACSAGHSSTFRDLTGNYWHVATMAICVRTSLERRLGLFPAGFTADGQLYCDTYLGDYPHYPPTKNFNGKDPRPNWMLLSYKKPATASSTLDPDHPVEKAFDENIRDWWAAKTGAKGEWLEVDLGKACRIEAIQTNFADEGARAYGMLNGDSYQYIIEVSGDGQTWKPCIDKSQNKADAPHDYVQLPAPVTGRYVRLTNFHCPAGAKLSISGFRIFGSGQGAAPDEVTGIKTAPDPDPRRATISWAPVKNADFYIVRYGLASDRMYSNYQVYEGTKLDLPALNVGVSYVATVDSVNDSGVTLGTSTVAIP